MYGFCMSYVDWIRSEFARTRKKQKDLAKHLGVAHPQISRLLSGVRQLKANEIDKVAEFFGGQVPGWLGRSAAVPVVGYVADGARVHYHDSCGSAPALASALLGASESSVALEVRDSSLGSAVKGCVIHFDDRKEPMGGHLLRKLCVVGLTDGRTLVRRIMPGSEPGRFHLLSDAEGLEEDVEIAWASLVKAMVPKDQ